MITNVFLSEVAKALAGDSYVVPSYMAFGSTVITPLASATTLTGAFGARNILTDGVATNVITWSGIRSGALSASAGDTLNGIAFFSASVVGSLLSVNTLSSIIHTTAFDIAVDYALTVNRP